MRAIHALFVMGFVMASQADIQRMVEELLLMREAQGLPPPARMVPFAPTTRTGINDLGGMSRAEREEYDRQMRKTPMPPPPEVKPPEPRQAPANRQFWQNNPWDW